MSLMVEYERATLDAEIARLRRVIMLRAMLLNGQSQRDIAKRLGVTQPAISYQVASERTEGARPSHLVAAGRGVLREVAQSRGFTELAVFGSAARGDDRVDSDLDFLVQPPADADMFSMVHLEEAFEAVLGRSVDIVSYRGLDPTLDHDILQDKVLV